MQWLSNRVAHSVIATVVTILILEVALAASWFIIQSALRPNEQIGDWGYLVLTLFAFVGGLWLAGRGLRPTSTPAPEESTPNTFSEPKLLAIYQMAAQLDSKETEYLNNRTNLFLAMNSLFFAGFLVFITSDLMIDYIKGDGDLKGGVAVLFFSRTIPIVGMFWSSMQVVITLRTRTEQLRWRSKAINLERMLELGNLQMFAEMGIPSWSRSTQDGRQSGNFLTVTWNLLLTKFTWIWRAATGPNVILGLILPCMFFAIWVMALVWMLWGVP